MLPDRLGRDTKAVSLRELINELDAMDVDLKRMRLTGAVDIHQDIITGIVMQRPCLDDLLDAIKPGDALVATALDRLGRDTWVSWSR